MIEQQDERARASVMPRLLALHSIFAEIERDQSCSQWLDLDLTMPQFKLLLLIASKNGARVGDLAQQLGVTPPTVTTLLDRLVDQALVRRENDAIDRRLVLTRLTEQGNLLLQRLHIATNPMLTDCIADLADAELQMLHSGLEALYRAWQRRNNNSKENAF